MSSQVRHDVAAALLAGKPVRARRTWRDVNCRRFVDKGQFIAGAELAPVSLDTTLSTGTEKEWPS